MNNEIYWDKKIIEWENSLKGEGKISLVEKLASYFRKPLKTRMAMCLDILKPMVKDKTVLELGCGSGFFAVELCEQSGPKHLMGIDISPNAIHRAQQMAQEKGLSDKLTFLTGNVTDTALPAADFTVGLGFLDYLSPEEIKTLFRKIKSPYFLFTFSEKKISLLRYIHVLYLKSQKCSTHFYYTKKEIADFIGDKHGEAKFVSDRKLSFGCIVHNRR